MGVNFVHMNHAEVLGTLTQGDASYTSGARKPDTQVAELLDGGDGYFLL